MRAHRKTNLGLLVCLLLPILGLAVGRAPAAGSALSATTENTSPTPARIEYGIDCRTLQVFKDTVQPGQSLSDILRARGVSPSRIHALAEKSKGVFDVRKLKAGNRCCIISQAGSPLQVRYFIYEIDPVEYVVFDLGDPARVYRERKPVEIRLKTVSGRIDSSLWEVFARQRLDFELAFGLSEIFAWTVDFHHLQKNDRFTIVFEEVFTDGQPVGTDRILAAKFTQEDKDYYAFFFQQGEAEGYYDETANSVQKAFLKAPIKYSRITSGFSKRRLHPILKTYRAHLGIDYAAPRGTPIMSVGDGVVQRAAYDRENGKYVKIRHNGVYATQYLHMSKIPKRIKPGVRVKQGEVIGYVGSTGLATGPHLCFRFWKNGRQVNPARENIPFSNPLQPRYREAFACEAASLRQLLDQEAGGRVEREPAAVIGESETPR